MNKVFLAIVSILYGTATIPPKIDPIKGKVPDEFFWLVLGMWVVILMKWIIAELDDW